MRDRDNSIVWIPEPGVYGSIVGPMGAFFSMVRYTYQGFDCEVLLENEDFELIGD